MSSPDRLSPASRSPLAPEQITGLATDTPELLVHLPALRDNITRMAAMTSAAGMTLRPHTKTHKMPEVAHMQTAAGLSGLMVAKLSEAEVFVDAGFTDILIGHPIVGATKLTRLARLAERARITVSLDALEVAQGISAAAAERGTSVRILLEVETGMRRVGVRPGAGAVDLALALAELPATEFAGLLTIEGHAYMAADEAEARRLTLEACSALADTAAEITARGVPVDTISVGSSHTARFAAGHPAVTELRPGTYVFNDRTQLAQGAATDADLAAFVVATVVSHPAADYAVLDAGTKALTSDQMIVPDGVLGFGTVYGRDGWDIIRASEEHSIVSIPSGASVAIGDRVAIVPNHICPVVNLFDEVTVFENDAVVDHWQVAARGRLR